MYKIIVLRSQSEYEPLSLTVEPPMSFDPECPKCPKSQQRRNGSNLIYLEWFSATGSRYGRIIFWCLKCFKCVWHVIKHKCAWKSDIGKSKHLSWRVFKTIHTLWDLEPLGPSTYIMQIHYIVMQIQISTFVSHKLWMLAHVSASQPI